MICVGGPVMCSVPECVKPARSGVNRYCEMHYYRVRRHGRVGTVRIARGWTDTRGYRWVNRPAHFLADAEGRVYEHRIVLFEKIGPGAHPCHWCGHSVTWDLSYYYGGGSDALVSDHVDGNKMNNAPTNLVPACNPCNASRGRRSIKNPMTKEARG